jgi:ATP-dependent protease ClpP protease subunit
MPIFNKSKVSIDRKSYAMAMSDGENAEIKLYGDIVAERPKDWWTDEPVEDDYIIASEFLEDLKQVQSAKKITLRIHSVGGDAFEAITIHNRIRELKAEVVAKVDGVAMSGGSMIMCAADSIQVNPSSLIMIHKCSHRLMGYYNSDELQQVIHLNDAVDKAQSEIYSRKTGLSNDVVLALMADTTYMTGVEAVEKGFADVLTDEERLEIAASADCKTLYVNGRALQLQGALLDLPDYIPTVTTASAGTTYTKPPKRGDQTEGGKTMAKTLAELRAENPGLAEALLAEAKAENADIAKTSAEAERERIAAIDEIAALYDAQLVHEAKYGENPCTAQELAFKAAQVAAKKGAKFLDDSKSDTDASGTKDVPAASTGNANDAPITAEAKREYGRQIAREAKGKKGETQNG